MHSNYIPMQTTHLILCMTTALFIFLALFVTFVQNDIPIRLTSNITLLQNETRKITINDYTYAIHLKSINETFFKLTSYNSQGTLIFDSCVDTLCKIVVRCQGHLIIENLSSYTENNINVTELIGHDIPDLLKFVLPTLMISMLIASFTYRWIGSVVCYERVDTKFI